MKRELGVLAGLALLCAGFEPFEPFEPFGSPGHPWVPPAAPAAPAAAAPAGSSVAAASHPLRGAYEVYRRTITTIDGPRCAHRPSCSRYAWEAVRAHGVVIGAWLAVDRLVRGDRSSALRPLPESRWDGVLRLDDPLGEATFWLR